MGVNEQMYNLFMRLNDEDKESVVEMIEAFIKGKAYDDGRISIEQYNKELEEADRRIDAGDFTTHEDLLEEMKSW